MRALAADDVQWMAALMARRRAEYEAYSPVFWRRAGDVEGLHARFLGMVIGRSDAIALRSDLGFITALARDDLFNVDDFAPDTGGEWAVDGAALLAAAWSAAQGRGRRRSGSFRRASTPPRWRCSPAPGSCSTSNGG